MRPTVTLKGIRDGILITVGEGNWLEAQAALLENLQQQAEFLKGAQVTIDVGSHELHAAQMGKLRDGISELGISVRAILSNMPITERTARTLGLATRISQPHPRRIVRSRQAAVQTTDALWVQRTLRSGVSLTHTGHIVLVGDVNPGAEVIAGGNVIVWGRLRGVAHAGADGNEQAYVCALDFSPTQLRIAGQIAIPPERKGKPQPELGRLKNGQVVVEKWDFKGKK